MSRLVRRPAGSGGIPPRDEARGTTASVRAIGRPRRAVVDAVVAEKRAAHPELAGRVTLPSLVAVLERDGIDVLFLPIARGLGRCSAFDGDASIVVSSHLPPPQQLQVLAHEAGHAWLHCAPADGWFDLLAAERRQLGRAGPIEEQLEAEAELVAAQLLGISLAAFTRRFQRMHARRALRAAA